MTCYSCGAHLTADEIGLYKKLVNRGAQEYMCLHCLAKRFNCTEEMLNGKIAQFREMGCTLFTAPKPPV